jgi:proline iminopeptidase
MISKSLFKMIRRTSAYLIMVTIPLLVSGCGMETTELGALVPPTVDQEPNYPALAIEVAGQERLVHYQTFGDPRNPVLFIMPGSLSDICAYLPLQVLQDKYFVVFWEQRGNGLSERVTERELSYDAMVEEIHAIKNHFSPDRPVTLMGHSWSAVFAAMYLAKHPEAVDQAILMEPFGLKSEFMEAVDVPLHLTSKGYLDMMYSSKYMTARDHEMLDYQMLSVLKSGVRSYFCDEDHLPPWPVCRVGGYALLIWEKNLLKGTRYDYDFTRGLAAFSGEVLLIGSSCSPIGYAFQETYHLPLFQHARVLKIENSGHRIVTEQYHALLDGLQDFLTPYQTAVNK